MIPMALLMIFEVGMGTRARLNIAPVGIEI